MSRFSILLGLGAALLCPACYAADPVPSAPAESTPAEATQTGTLQSTHLNELSGFAASRRYPGLLYAHNDSGDTARVFLIRPTGEVVAEIKLKGAYARDWEDMTFAGDYLYVGDTGDNLSWRDAIQVYRLKEPELDPTKLDQKLEADAEVVALTYPGGARDAETLLASPDGHMWILSKDKKGSQLYTTTFEVGKTQDLKKVGDKMEFGATGLFTKLATGGDFSSDGTKLAIVTYAQLYEWKLSAPFDVSNLATLKPVVRDLPKLKQCESVCYTPDATQIYVSSEGKNAPIYSIKSAF